MTSGRVVAALHLYGAPAAPLVVKFGGTSLATPARMRRAARRVAGFARRGRPVVVVVSAMGRRTDEILRWARAVCGTGANVACSRDVDRAVATGEELSAGLMAAALSALRVRAVALRGGEAGVRAEGGFGAGRIAEVRVDRLAGLLAEGKVAVVAGFQGERGDGETLTLERGGSDITAVAIAGALGASCCHIVTDVAAVYDRDPRQHATAAMLRELSHRELLALTEAGAHVVHHRAALLAHSLAVPLRVYSYRAPLSQPGGTRIRTAAVESSDAVAALRPRPGER